MRVDILKPVMFRGEVKRSGTIEVPDPTAKHWLKNGAARGAVDPQPQLVLDPSTHTKTPAGKQREKGL